MRTNIAHFPPSMFIGCSTMLIAIMVAGGLALLPLSSRVFAASLQQATGSTCTHIPDHGALQ